MITGVKTIKLVPNKHVFIVSDDTELYAQVPTEVPSSKGQWYPQTPVFYLQDLCFQGDRIYCRHCVPKRKSKYPRQLKSKETKFQN